MVPLAVAVHSVAILGGFRANQSVVIFGCGPVGLLCMAVAKALGGSRIIAVDILPRPPRNCANLMLQPRSSGLRH